MHYKIMIIISTTLIAFASCIGPWRVTPDSGRGLQSDFRQKEKILIIVVESNDFENDLLEAYYDNVIARPVILGLFGEVFGIDPGVLGKNSLNEIIDKYGEQFIIDRIVKCATRHYKKIIALNDEKASFAYFLKCINSFDPNNYSIDLILDLHAGPDILEFADHQVVEIQTIISGISDIKIIRSVYQTCCYGSSMIEEWTSAGVSAVNGSQGVNSFVFYSPSIFLENWIAGKTFLESVQDAYNREKVILDDFINKHLIKGVSSVIISAKVQEDSAQIIGGDKLLLWN